MNKKNLAGIAFVAFAVLTMMPAAQAGEVGGGKVGLEILIEGAPAFPDGSCAGVAKASESQYTGYRRYSCTGVYNDGTSYVCVGTYNWNSNDGGYCTGVQK